MYFKALNPILSVSAQLMPEDITSVIQAGFKSIVCNRPDGEEVGQPSFLEIQDLAIALGLECRYFPVTSETLGDQALHFRELIASLPQPVLAYCRSGMRSSILWGLTTNG